MLSMRIWRASTRRSSQEQEHQIDLATALGEDPPDLG
jgi:hypothetical protein